MKFFLISLAAIIVIVFVSFYGSVWRPGAPAFEPIPLEQREPFGLDFSLPTLQGETLHLADLQGQVVLLNIWATWCYPCRVEMPSMAALYHRYRAHRAFTIIAVANDPQGREVVAPFTEEQDLPFPVLLDATNSLGTQLGISGIPTSYLLDQQGRIVLYEVGQRDWNHPDMHQLVDALLAAPPGS